MTDTVNTAAPIANAPTASRGAAQLTTLNHPATQDPLSPQEMTPAGFQARRSLTQRRVLMATLCLVTFAAIASAAGWLLSGGGWTWLDIGIFVCIMVSAPWTVLGFWNAVIGLWLLRCARDPFKLVSPFLKNTDSELRPIQGRVAVFMTLRNEDVERAYQRLIAMRQSLDDTGQGGAYDFFVLSDSSNPEVIAQEEALFAANQTQLDGRGQARYRRREHNTGFKAGNVRDFLGRWGDAYEFMLPLDADSVMSGEKIVEMTRIIERHPKLGILQSLAVGAPASSPFARLFQFGMRHGMRSFTMGSAWWQGDCGPFWGHNALVRVAPFKSDCELPDIGGKPPLGGPILSHDQVEAALMRRAGYEVRVAPVEGDSWEDNPVTLLDFMKREQRWCNGNMQYWPLLGLPGLRPTSRFQLLQAILMYLGPPAWMLMTALATLKVFESDMADFEPMLAIGLFFTMFFMSLAPKLAGFIDVALEPGGMRRYGGPARFGVSSLMEILFGMLMAPAVALRLTIFLGGLVFGQRISWNGQVRDAYGLRWSTAWLGLWPQSIFGLAIVGVFAVMQPAVLPWAAPVAAGLLFAPAFAVLTASPRFGDFLRRFGLVTIPEERQTSPMLARVDATQLVTATDTSPRVMAAE